MSTRLLDNTSHSSSMDTTATPTDTTSEASTTINGTVTSSTVPSDKGSIDSFMYEVMGSVLGAVFFIIVLISVAFFIKQHRKRRQNVEISRNHQRNLAGIPQDEDNVDASIHSTHHPLYGQNVKRDNHDANLTLNCDSSATRNGTYANSGVVVNPDSMYDLPRPTGNQNSQNDQIENRNEESPSSSKVTTFAGQRSPNVNIIMEEMETRNTNIGTDEHVCDENPDYENSPEKVRKVNIQQGNHLQTVPPPNNGKMVGLKIQDNSAMSESTDKMKQGRQKSDYEDPDNVVAILQLKKKEDSKDGIPEYSNLTIPGMVMVKSERSPSWPTCDYENEDTMNAVRRKGPPVPIKHAHTTTTFDRPNRPVVQKRGRFISNSDHVILEQADDMYVPMTGASEEDDMYLPMDSHNDGVEQSFSHQLKPLPKPNGKEKITKPEPLPKPVKQMVPKRNFDKSVLLSVRPPPCGVNQRSNTEYVNYDESPKYVNLFRSKSNDDVYIYADSHFNYE